MKSKLSHIEINVGNYAQSIRFYDLVLTPVGWTRFLCTKTHTVYCDGLVKLILSPTEDRFIAHSFHRKKIGLNHLAFYVNSKDEVIDYYKNVLKRNNISTLYQEGPFGDDDYFSVLFEDPDRMKLEIVYAPKYVDRESWPNTLVDDFNPY